MERLQLQLQNISGALGISGPGVETELKAVRALLVQNQFASALATRHALKNRLRASKILKHHADDASNLARDVCKIYTVMIYIHMYMGNTRGEDIYINNIIFMLYNVF